MRKPYYVTEGTRITQYLLNLQNEPRTFGLVVDEHGDFKGFVTLEEMLEEIVGEFTSNIPESGTRLRLAEYPIEVLRTRDTAVDIARIQPTMNRDGRSINEN